MREPVFSVTPMGQGARSRVYRVETEEGAVRVLRLSTKDSGRVEREQWVSQVFAANSLIKLVSCVRVSGVALAAECDVVSMRAVPGQTMGLALRSALPATRRALFKALGEGLATIHAQAVQGFSLVDRVGKGRYASWQECFTAISDGALEELRVSPLNDLRETCSALVRDLRAKLPTEIDASLLHGDVQPMNVLVQHDQIVAWIDWEFAMGGDPLYELAYVETLFEYDYAPWVDDHERGQWRAAFYQGYGVDPLSTQSTQRVLYGLVHALRSTEFSSVVAPTLAPALRATSLRGMRSRILSFLEQAQSL